MVSNRAQEKVVVEEFEPIDLGVVFEAVHFLPAVVVDVRVFTLRAGEELAAVHKLDVANRLLELHLGYEFIV